MKMSLNDFLDRMRTSFKNSKVKVYTDDEINIRIDNLREKYTSGPVDIFAPATEDEIEDEDGLSIDEDRSIIVCSEKNDTDLRKEELQEWERVFVAKQEFYSPMANEMFPPEEEYMDELNEKIEGKRPLHIAIKNNDLKEVKRLVEAGADITLTDNNRHTAKQYCKIIGKRDEIYQFLAGVEAGKQEE